MTRKDKLELRLPNISDPIYKEVMKLGVNDRESIYNHIVASIIYNKHILTQIRSNSSKQELKEIIEKQERELEAV